uniref:DNA-directed RNA polymerase 1B isoform X2 n=1 Tax=Rhizophora mucronata TaxID=61149 RepID=A0A2P2MCR6_RHIMU
MDHLISSNSTLGFVKPGQVLWYTFSHLGIFFLTNCMFVLHEAWIRSLQPLWSFC